MKKISAANMFFLKRIFPAIFCAVPVFMVVTMFMQSPGKQPPVVALIFPFVFMFIAFVIFRRLVFDLADEVMDGGDFLLVRKGGKEERIPLTNIMNVSVSTNVNPPRITLRLVNPGKFGDEIAFSPPREFSLKLFARNKLADDLMVRVDRARVNRPR